MLFFSWQFGDKRLKPKLIQTKECIGSCNYISEKANIKFGRKINKTNTNLWKWVVNRVIEYWLLIMLERAWGTFVSSGGFLVKVLMVGLETDTNTMIYLVNRFGFERFLRIFETTLCVRRWKICHGVSVLPASFPVVNLRPLAVMHASNTIEGKSANYIYYSRPSGVVWKVPCKVYMALQT